MAKPAGAACNLDCQYCFYLSKESLPHGPLLGRMSDETLERYIQQYIQGVTGDEVVFSWQGGEPTLMGLDFFRKVVALEKKYAQPGRRIENDLQTNGTLLNDDWCAFLKENRFLRDEVGSTYMQFIPIVEYQGFERTAPQCWDHAALPRDGDPEARPGHPRSMVTDWSVDSDDWGYFLCRAFDRWLSRDVGRVLVNHFETLVAQHLGLPSQVCVYGEICGKGVAVEHDGSVYACDHYVYPEYRLGRIQDRPLGDLVCTRAQVKFGYAKNETLPSDCRQCAYLRDCWGECPKNRILRTAGGEPGLNYLCRGLKTFFAHAWPEIERLAAKLRQQPLRPARRM
jgi:radical SAM protein with 4Fe4S-binding SPASM domain